MLLCIGATDKIQVVTGQAVTVDAHASAMDVDASGVVTTYRKNTAITTATTTDITAVPSSGSTRNVKTINIRNKHASSSVDVTVQHTDGTTTVELHKTNLAAGEALIYVEGVGFSELPSSSATLGGVGTPSTTSQSLTASTANVVTGTLLQLPTANLKVGSRFRFHIGVDKTAAGIATWAAALKWGTAGTVADAAVATWTSGTNTAAIDQATLDIEAVVTSLGSTAAMACIAFYVNTLTNVTGLGKINFIPSPTATFDSTLANPFIHVDITPGASAVMTSIASVERLA